MDVTAQVVVNSALVQRVENMCQGCLPQRLGNCSNAEQPLLQSPTLPVIDVRPSITTSDTEVTTKHVEAYLNNQLPVATVHPTTSLEVSPNEPHT